jgi:hypothetical protein
MVVILVISVYATYSALHYVRLYCAGQTLERAYGRSRVPQSADSNTFIQDDDNVTPVYWNQERGRPSDDTTTHQSLPSQIAMSTSISVSRALRSGWRGLLRPIAIEKACALSKGDRPVPPSTPPCTPHSGTSTDSERKRVSREYSVVPWNPEYSTGLDIPQPTFDAVRPAFFDGGLARYDHPRLSEKREYSAGDQSHDQLDVVVPHLDVGFDGDVPDSRHDIVHNGKKTINRVRSQQLPLLTTSISQARWEKAFWGIHQKEEDSRQFRRQKLTARIMKDLILAHGLHSLLVVADSAIGPERLYAKICQLIREFGINLGAEANGSLMHHTEVSELGCQHLDFSSQTARLVLRHVRYAMAKASKHTTGVQEQNA